MKFLHYPWCTTLETPKSIFAHASALQRGLCSTSHSALHRIRNEHIESQEAASAFGATCHLGRGRRSSGSLPPVKLRGVGFWNIPHSYTRNPMPKWYCVSGYESHPPLNYTPVGDDRCPATLKQKLLVCSGGVEEAKHEIGI